VHLDAAFGTAARLITAAYVQQWCMSKVPTDTWPKEWISRLTLAKDSVRTQTRLADLAPRSSLGLSRLGSVRCVSVPRGKKLVLVELALWPVGRRADGCGAQVELGVHAGERRGRLLLLLLETVDADHLWNSRRWGVKVQRQVGKSGVRVAERRDVG
jgi:hypothetical protein